MKTPQRLYFNISHKLNGDQRNKVSCNRKYHAHTCKSRARVVFFLYLLYSIFMLYFKNMKGEYKMSIKKAETTKISLVLDNETLEKIKIIAKNNKTSMSTIIREAIWTTFLFNNLEVKNANTDERN